MTELFGRFDSRFYDAYSEVLPSDDIRRAAMEFDGPTVAYATDTCASGGYWIASGCDATGTRSEGGT